MNNLHSGLLYSLTGVTALASMSSCASQKKTEEQKPFNIVYIMTDDHTAQMMSCYDKRYMETPNLDRIANDGVRFTNSFMIIRRVYLTLHSRLSLSCCKKQVTKLLWWANGIWKACRPALTIGRLCPDREITTIPVSLRCKTIR